MRTAAGLGLDAVFLCPGTVELANPKTLRAAAGSVFRLPVFEHVAVPIITAWLGKTGGQLFVADAHRGGEVLGTPPAQRWALVVGGETLPLDSHWSAAPSHWVRLQLAHGIESLNAAVAGAILMDRLCRRPPATRGATPPAGVRIHRKGHHS